MLTTLATIQAARERIRGAVHRTPLFSASSLGAPYDIELYLKAELFQKTGSFKVRGVTNTVRQLSPTDIARGFITLSAGNHGAALSWAATAAGTKATVVMPAHAMPSKIEKVRAYGGEPVLVTGSLIDAVQRLQAERGLTMVHPFDDPEMIAGHASVGLEILEDVPEPDVVIVPVGGGGLISGIASTIKLLRPQAQVIGVEPTGAAVIVRSLQAGSPQRLDRPMSVADGLCAPFAGEHTFAHIRERVDQVVLVEDDAIMRALRSLIERAKLAPEPAGAASLAAIQSGAVRLRPKARVVCVVSGGNAEPAVLQRALS